MRECTVFPLPKGTFALVFVDDNWLLEFPMIGFVAENAPECDAEGCTTGYIPNYNNGDETVQIGAVHYVLRDYMFHQALFALIVYEDDDMTPREFDEFVDNVLSEFELHGTQIDEAVRPFSEDIKKIGYEEFMKTRNKSIWDVYDLIDSALARRDDAPVS